MANELPKLSEEFRDFLVEAKQHGHGTNNARKLSIPSGGGEIIYQDGNWLYTDNYVGGDPKMGYEHVSYKRKNGKEYWLPVWGMNYASKVLDPKFLPRVDKALSTVLSKPATEMPLRGPFEDSFGSYGYRFQYEGSLESFRATESFHNGKELYTAQFLGGLANMQVWGSGKKSKPWLENDG